MKHIRFFSACTGFGGFEIGAREAGMELVGGIEIDPAIAAVANANLGGHITVANLLDCNPEDFPDAEWLHISPPCPRFSVANAKGGEDEIDLLLARKIREFIRAKRPLVFSLENVIPYRRSLSILNIWYELLELGYAVDAWNLNAADYGVPQLRRRLILVARRDGRQPVKPFPTHARKPDFFTRPYVGWYEAIEDLIPDLPDSEFADWQMRRLPKGLTTGLMMTGNTNKKQAQSGKGYLPKNRPANTVTACENGSGATPRAFLLANGSYGGKIPVTKGSRPANTITANINQGSLRAFVVSGSQGGLTPTVRNHDEPAPTVTASDGGRVVNRAYLVDGSLSGGRKLKVSNEEEPAMTVMASRTNNHGRRAVNADGRVVRMTPRVLARWQGFPDSYELPVHKSLGSGESVTVPFSEETPGNIDTPLATKGIGNAVPPLLAYHIIRANL